MKTAEGNTSIGHTFTPSSSDTTKMHAMFCEEANHGWRVSSGKAPEIIDQHCALGIKRFDDELGSVLFVRPRENSCFWISLTGVK